MTPSMSSKPIRHGQQIVKLTAGLKCSLRFDVSGPGPGYWIPVKLLPQPWKSVFTSDRGERHTLLGSNLCDRWHVP